MEAKHPKGIYILFLAEMWERFSFYGMRALLVLFMTQQMLLGDEKAYGIYGAYMSLVYASPVIGGFIADKFLGLRRAVTLGGILIALGHFVLAINEQDGLYLGLAFIICGTGFFKSCVSSIVGQLYVNDDKRRDSGFTIFYMGINLGAFLAPIACGIIADQYGWDYGFGLAGIGMVFGLIVFEWGKRYLRDCGHPPDLKLLQKKLIPGVSVNTLIILLAFATVPLISLLMNYEKLVGDALTVIVIVAISAMLYLALRSDRDQRNKLLALMVLMFFSVFFFALFEQAGSSLTLFADREVNRQIFGWTVPTPLFQSLNALFIVLLAPLFAMLWIRLGKSNKEPSTPSKFGYGLVGVGLGFGLIALGSILAGADAKSNMIWLIGAYFMHTVGELCLSPVGLSAVTRLAPQRYVGSIMGVWFLALAFSNYVAAQIAILASIETDVSDATVVYTDVFFAIGLIGVAAGIVMWVLTPLLKKMIRGTG